MCRVSGTHRAARVSQFFWRCRWSVGRGHAGDAWFVDVRCESGDHRGEARAEGPLIIARFEGDGVAELFELVDESAGAVFGGAAALGRVRAEVGVVDLVVHDVPVGDQQVVAGGADGLGQAAAAADVGVVRGEVGVFRRAAACAASVSAVRNATEPCRVRRIGSCRRRCCCPGRSPPSSRGGRGCGTRSCPPRIGEQHDRGPDGDTGDGAHPLEHCGKGAAARSRVVSSSAMAASRKSMWASICATSRPW